MSKKIVPPLKWHGGKQYLAERIIGLMPPRCKNPNAPAPDDDGWLHYVEPYFGGGAVLLANDPTGISEVVNDKNGELALFWRVLKNDGLFGNFWRKAQSTPFSQSEWTEAGAELGQPTGTVAQALAFFVRCRQSLAGRQTNFAPLTKNRTRRGMNEQASAWLNSVEGLPAVHSRLQRVVILDDEALDVIRREDGPRTLFYLDPPYLHETRATTGEYAHEMTHQQHVALLNVLAGVEGRFLLSGYRSELYDKWAVDNGWKRHDFELPNNAAGGKSKRRMVECVWCNF